jgi:hypothetical protein
MVKAREQGKAKRRQQTVRMRSVKIVSRLQQR